MIIRNYEKKDIEKINKLGLMLHNNYDFKLDRYSNCLILEDYNEFIGFIVYSVIYERAEIIDIIINPLNRKKGYGKKLLEEVILKVKENKCQNITLEVSRKNKIAVSLYKNYGFKIQAIRKKYYNGDDGYLMMLDLR